MPNSENIEQMAFWEDIDVSQITDEHFEQYQAFCALLNSEFATHRPQAQRLRSSSLQRMVRRCGFAS